MSRRQQGTGRSTVGAVQEGRTEVAPADPHLPPSPDADDEDHDKPGSIKSPWWLEEQAAEYLHKKPGTLSNWRSLGKGPRWTRIGYTPVYLQRWLDEFVVSQARGGDAK